MSPQSTQATRDLIVVGASAGGVEALRTLVAGLPPDLPAAVAVVLHLPAGGTSALPSILDRAGPLHAVAARNGMALERGTIYVAPADHHLLVMDGELALSHGPNENGHRPSINPLFRSAAAAAGPRVIGVILSGVLDDGVAGLAAIAGRGGLAAVQDPADALYPSMPSRALQHVQARCVLPAAELGAALGKLAHETVDETMVPPASLDLKLANAISGNPTGAAGMAIPNGTNDPTFSCPDCQGVLTEVDRETGRYCCRVGHSWSAEALLAAQGSALERALWTALRTLDEKVALATRMRDQAKRNSRPLLVERYKRMADEAMAAADVLRGYLTSTPALDATETEL